MLIKYIKSILWRVVKRLSYIQDARCLKFNSVLVDVRHIHTNKYTTNICNHITTVNLASTDSAPPDDGVTAPKHVGAILM